MKEKPKFKALIAVSDFDTIDSCLFKCLFEVLACLRLLVKIILVKHRPYFVNYLPVVFKGGLFLFDSRPDDSERIPARADRHKHDGVVRKDSFKLLLKLVEIIRFCTFVLADYHDKFTVMANGFRTLKYILRFFF